MEEKPSQAVDCSRTATDSNDSKPLTNNKCDKHINLCKCTTFNSIMCVLYTKCVNYWSNLAEMPHFGINFTKQKFNIATNYASSVFYAPMLVAKKSRYSNRTMIEHSQSVSHWN